VYLIVMRAINLQSNIRNEFLDIKNLSIEPSLNIYAKIGLTMKQLVINYICD